MGSMDNNFLHNFSRDTSVTTPVTKLPDELLRSIASLVKDIEYSSVEENREKIRTALTQLQAEDAGFPPFYEKILFEGLKIFDKEYLTRSGYEKVSSKGSIVDGDGRTMAFPSSIDYTEKRCVELASMKYYTENKQVLNDDNDLSEYVEKLAHDMSPLVSDKIAREERSNKLQEESQKKVEENREKHRAIIHKEVLEVFSGLGIPLNGKLTDMLNEADTYQGGRTGSGYTTFFRELATYVNDETKNPLTIFSDEDISIESVKNKLAEASEKLTHPSHAIAVNMIRDIVRNTEKEGLPSLDTITDPENVAGTCTTAEIYYFNFKGLDQSGNGYDGLMNIITDNNDQPVMIQKVGMGEKTCLTLQPLQIRGIEIPVGSMVQAIEREYMHTSETGSRYFPNKINMDQFEGFRFLRITTLSLPPEVRSEVFGNHYFQQMENQYVNYDWVETKHYQELVNEAL